MRRAIRVWAPLPRRVALQFGAQRLPMNSSEDGWWQAEIPSNECSDYGFILDGEGPFPDPRSLWQPHGVHGLSRMVDQNSFRWSDDGWQPPVLSEAIIYELHIGTFTPEGTFKAAIEKLDYLVSLGVTHVELMPVNEFPGERGWGYDGVDLFAPYHVYGGPEGLKRFVDACHSRKLAVLLDVVYNHLGHSGNYLGKFGPYFTSRYSTPWGPALNFDDRGSDEVRRFFCDNALMWLRDFHFDGLRLDAVHAIFDTSAQPFLEQLKLEVEELERRLGRRLVLIAESDLNDPRLLWKRERGGFALDAQWSDDFHHSLHSILTGERQGYYYDFGSLADLAKCFQQPYLYDGRYSCFRRRRHGRPAEGLNGHRFVACLQNHDQVGNRARGDRSDRLMSLGLLKAGSALLLTSPYVPLLFQGQEWGASTPFLFFTDHEEELGEAIREGRRREFAEFGWKPEEVPDPQAAETFAASKLDWRELSEAPHADLLHWHKELIRLRRSEPALLDGRFDVTKVQYDEKERRLVVERGPITIACNLGSGDCSVPLGVGIHRRLLTSEQLPEKVEDCVKLPAASVVILKREENPRV